jgi:hypothetical protein
VTNANQEKYGFFGPAGVLGVGLTASVWHGWSGPVLLALALALLVLALPIRLPPVSLGFLVVGALVLPLTSLGHGRDLDHFYGLAVFLLLGFTGLLLGLHSSPNSVAMGIALNLSLIIALTIWTVLVNPLDAFNQTPYYFGALTGPFDHRNALGALLGFGIVPLVLLPQQRCSIELFRWALLGVSSALLVATQSLTPVLALAIAVTPSLLSAMPHKRRWGRPSSTSNPRSVWVIFLVATGGLCAAVLLPLILEWRPTLSSRVSIWKLVIGKLSEEFPYPPESGWIDSAATASALGFAPAHSHNAVLDLFLIYGVLPTAVFWVAVVGAIVTVRNVQSGSWARPYWDSPIVSGILLYMLVHSTVESIFLAGPVGALMCGVAGGLALGSRSESLALVTETGSKTSENR